jgi:hypothetical protein
MCKEKMIILEGAMFCIVIVINNNGEFTHNADIVQCHWQVQLGSLYQQIPYCGINQLQMKSIWKKLHLYCT